MRIQSVVLEYHRDISVLWLNVIYQLAVDVQLTRGNILQTCDHTKGSGLTAAGRTYEDDKFLICNLKVKVLNSNETVGVLLGNISKG